MTSAGSLDSRLGLEGEATINKRHPGIVKVHKRIMQEYEGGRVTSISRKEMEHWGMSMGPAEVCGLLLGYQNYYLGLLDDPKRIQNLMEMVTGLIIGSGIFASPNVVAKELPSAWLMLLAMIALYFAPRFGALAGTLAAGFLPTPRQAQWLFEHGAYYFLLALVAAWTLKGWSLYGHHLKTWGPRRLAALVLAAVLTVMIFIHSPPRFKILADESNLVGLSMMMHSERVAAVPIEGFVTDQRQADLVTAPDKRPLLFPFLVSVIHTLIGYSPSNGFLLNFATTLAALLSFALAASRLFGPAMALPSILMLASAPILSFYATGSGFEILNMLFMMLTFMVLLEVVDSEAAPDRVELLFLTALMLAHCRYESAIVLVLLALFLAIICSPAVTWMTQRRIPAALAVLAIVIALLAFFSGLGAIVGGSVNDFTAFAAQYQGFADVNLGQGIVVSGLASVMLGEFIIK